MIGRRSGLGAIAAGAFGAWLPVAQASTNIHARVGLVLPLTGVQSTVANELLTGYRLAAAQARRAGIELEYLVEDDRSEPVQTADAVRKLGLDRSVVAISGVVGTPHAMAAIPEARAAQVPLVGIRSGASQLRDGKGLVFHLRASYEAELDRMLRMLADTTPALSVVYSNDSFGNGALRHLQGQAGKAGIRLVAAVPAERNGADIDSSVRRAIAPALGSQALVLLMITRPAVQGLRTARQAGFYGPTFTMSFTAGGELQAAGDVVRGLGLVSAFPLPRDSVDAVARSFRLAAESLGNSDIASSITALEGFVYGSTIAAGVARCAPTVNRESLVTALTRHPGVRIGADFIEFGAQLVGRNHLQVIYFDRQGALRA